MLKSRTVLAIVLSAQLCGCTSGIQAIKRRASAYEANNPALAPADISKFSLEQNIIMLEFAKMAGTVPSGREEVDALLDVKEWRAVVDAGIHYTDVRCDKFMDALFWFNRAREGLSRQVQYTGAGVSAALAAVEASKKAIGLTPLGFSLVDQTINNLGAGLLFNLNPSTVRVLVERQQTAYIASLSPSYTSRVVALQVIQNYAAICLPPSIETEVERAISSQEYKRAQVHSPLPNSAEDVTPDPFQFMDVTDAAPGSDVDSAEITVKGFGSPVFIKISGGAYSVDGGPWSEKDGAILPGSKVKVRVKASKAANTATTAMVSIGGISATFKVTTKAAGAGGIPVAPQVAPPPEQPPAPAAAEEPGISGPMENSPDVNGLPNPTPKD